MMPAPQPPSPSAGRDWLAALLLRQPDRFVPRLAAALARWRAVPRAARRRLQRRVALSAAGAALVLAMAGSPLLVPAAHAATITVNETTCTLIDAIRAANTNAIVGGCTAGDAGADTIDLQADVTLTASYGYYYGSTGLPAVTSEIVLQGNGHTVERDDSATDFRILYVDENGDLSLNDVTISGGRINDSDRNGGGVAVYSGSLQVYDSTITGNWAGNYGGGIASKDGSVTIAGSDFTENYAGDEGGGVSQYYGLMEIARSRFYDNEANDDGGAIVNYYGEMTITESTLSGNEGYQGGAIYNDDELTITNSTLSGNHASEGGAIFNLGPTTVTNSTLTGNSATSYGGGIHNTGSTLTLSRSIVSGNEKTVGLPGHEIDVRFGSVTADDFNVLGHDGHTSGDAFYGFSPGASDVDASSDATDVELDNILDTNLANNGGPTAGVTSEPLLTHNLVAGSPAVDMAPDADCAAGPVNGLDQRGATRPFDVPGMGNDAPSPDTCDAGAVEYSPTASSGDIFMSTTVAGTTGDGLAFGPHDILEWDGSAWSKWFDGSAVGLTPNGKAKHNINAFFISDPDGESVLISFAQNARAVPGLPGKVDGTDVIAWDGNVFEMFVDGSDVGLSKLTSEKIDGLHARDGSDSPINGGDCFVYLLISTTGPGKVPNHSGGTLNFSGEDVLGFCATSLGPNTAGLWHMVLDGSAEGMPRNSTDSISLSADGQTLFLTTKGAFNVDSATGGHSMVYEYDFGTQEFSGPFFVAPAEGLPAKVDGLQ